MNYPEWVPIAFPFVFLVFCIVVSLATHRGDPWGDREHEQRREEKDRLRKLQIEYYERENARKRFEA